eukprot:TRINITY_DN24757_c0_g1_i1.p1 TRINITY_DN24757_c0_g1~~TRINITY_DN24757_c0_g1_i1.p1  ORF type:complete len:250 (+),score=54.81 TRINITY_DN24757_c0_g1_i1:211-960(+)
MSVAMPGAQRILHRVVDPTGALGLGSEYCVAKTYSMEARASHMVMGLADEVYFQDAQMQKDTADWVDRFNAQHPPKLISMAPAVVIQRIQQVAQPFYLVEPYLAGEYAKYNANQPSYTLLMSDSFPETPHAFSHFTHHHSHGEVLVCDIQGVGNRYTDPQIISTRNCDDYVVDLGKSAIRNWFSSHRCRSLCHNLGLKHQFLQDLSMGEERAGSLVNGWRTAEHVLFGFEMIENLHWHCTTNAGSLKQD